MNSVQHLYAADRHNHINAIMERFTKHISRLFGDSDEAVAVVAGFHRNLRQLTDEQIAVLDNPKLDMTSVSHDVRGIANKERHFLPRIDALKNVTPYLT